MEIAQGHNKKSDFSQTDQHRAQFVYGETEGWGRKGMTSQLMSHPDGSVSETGSPTWVTHHGPSQVHQLGQGWHPTACQEGSGWPGCLAWRACHIAMESRHALLLQLASAQLSRQMIMLYYSNATVTPAFCTSLTTLSFFS